MRNVESGWLSSESTVTTTLVYSEVSQTVPSGSNLLCESNIFIFLVKFPT